MNVTKRDGAAPIKAWTDGVPVEAAALDQVEKLARMPFVHSHIALMPDVHAGIGSTVGTVVATKEAIIPACVGVDIGCGMMAVRTSLTASDLPDNLFAMRSAIEAAVPHGRTDNGGANDKGAWSKAPTDAELAWRSIGERMKQVFDAHPKLTSSNGAKQLGTLGTGNHFIEVCLDEAQAVWIMLHSGSRGFGNRIGSYFIALAKQEMRRWLINLPDQDLAYLKEGSQSFEDYWRALDSAQEYALINRQLMMSATKRAIESTLGRPIGATDVAVQCHHNYVSREHHFDDDVFVTRKGAVNASKGLLGIIPGSMGAKSFIVRGKGNRDSFHSCSHGAGRRMSRTEAKRRFTLAEHQAATAGVECRKDESVLDETPAAYKSIDAVMAAQTDLVEVVHTLRQVLCVKG
jgi:tRNA-splicing ligase RtcB